MSPSLNQNSQRSGTFTWSIRIAVVQILADSSIVHLPAIGTGTGKFGIIGLPPRPLNEPSIA